MECPRVHISPVLWMDEIPHHPRNPAMMNSSATRPPVAPFYPFLGEGSPRKDYRSKKSGTNLFDHLKSGGPPYKHPKRIPHHPRNPGMMTLQIPQTDHDIMAFPSVSFRATSRLGQASWRGRPRYGPPPRPAPCGAASRQAPLFWRAAEPKANPHPCP